ncbi:MAG: LuxR C-terminal-related transcriptional regulator [Eggerthellaceae bacterium]|nr:LuxR C-terminal-related transcriptional regulator [Eggerthellaceae bacterium]
MGSNKVSIFGIAGTRLLKRMLVVPSEQPALVACSVLYWFWQLALFQTPSAFFYVEGGAPLGTTLYFMVACMVVYGIGWLRSDRANIVAKTNACRIAMIACMALGGVLFVLVRTWLASSPISIGIGIASELLVGVGSALFIVELGRVMAQLGPLYALIAGTFGVMGGALLYLLCFALPQVASLILLAFAGCAAAVLLEKTVSQFSRARLYSSGSSESLSAPVTFVVAAALQGVAFGVMSMVLPQFGVTGPTLCVVAFLLGACVAGVTALLFGMDFNHLVFEVGFGFLALGFMVLGCFAEYVWAGSLLLMMGYCFVYVVVTCVISYFSYCVGMDATRIVSLATFLLVLGQLAGRCISAGALFAGMDVSTLASVLACVLPIIALILVCRDPSSVDWGIARPDMGDDENALFYRAFSSVYRLTPREVEVLQLLARGRNKRHISKELGVSEETIKTHIGNVYRKTMVHSQQELIDLVEGERAKRASL